MRNRTIIPKIYKYCSEIFISGKLARSSLREKGAHGRKVRFDSLSYFIAQVSKEDLSVVFLDSNSSFASFLWNHCIWRSGDSACRSFKSSGSG